MIVALGFPLKVATLQLGCILSMLFSDFKAIGPISIPTPPTVALTESWYLISSLCVNLCSWMHIMSLLCSTDDAVSSGSCPILFKVLTLNVAICIVCLFFSNFCCLSSEADFSNTEARAPTSGGRAPFFLPARRAMRFMHVVWVWVMIIFRWLFLFSCIEANLIDEQQYIPDETNYPERWTVRFIRTGPG